MYANEKQIETSILDYLNSLRGCFSFKIHTGGIYDPKTKRLRTLANKHQHKGTSEIVGIHKGKFFAMEVKRPKTEISSKTYATKDQKLFIKRIIDNGGAAGVVRSVRDAVLFLENL